MIYDLNGFKRYNDTFGHPAGDALLTRLARKLEVALGSSGTCYRLGGDEFCTLAADADDRIERFLTRHGRAVGAGRQLRYLDRLRLLDPARGGRALRRGAPHVRSAPLRSEVPVLIARGRPHAVLLQALEEREPSLREHVGGSRG